MQSQDTIFKLITVNPSWNSCYNELFKSRNPFVKADSLSGEKKQITNPISRSKRLTQTDVMKLIMSLRSN